MQQLSTTSVVQCSARCDAAAQRGSHVEKSSCRVLADIFTVNCTSISPNPYTPLCACFWPVFCACRLLGVGFAVPGAYFLARGYINGALGRRLGLLFMMGGAQGLVGWWMVRSGLKVRGGRKGGRKGD